MAVRTRSRETGREAREGKRTTDGAGREITMWPAAVRTLRSGEFEEHKAKQAAANEK
jgi:hypothetical protein